MSSYQSRKYFSCSREATQGFANGIVINSSRDDSYVLTDTILGRDDPKWRDKVARGEDATGSLVRTIYSIRYNDNPSRRDGLPNTTYYGDWGVTHNHGVSTFDPMLLNDTAYYAYALSLAESAAITAIRNKVRDAQASFGGMTFLAELRETINGLRNPGKALVENLNSLIQNTELHKKAQEFGGAAKTAKGRRVAVQISRNKRARRRDALRDRARLVTGKTFAQTWLEFAFGWAPLVHDVKDIASALNAYFWRTMTQRVYAQSGPIQRSSTYDYGENSSAGISCAFTTSTVVTVTVKYVAGVKREVSGPGGQIRNLLGDAGTVSDIGPAIWELIPWSWLLDYVMNIGDIISAACQSMVGVEWISKTTIITVERRTVSAPKRDQPGFKMTYTGNSAVYSKFTKITRERVEPSALGVPRLTFTLPGSKQLFNVAALLRTFLRN